MQLEEFVILESAEITFSHGLNVVTGETGTGKSILCDAIGYLAGGRGDAGWLREGAAQMQVSGLFDVDRLPTTAATATRLGFAPQKGRLSVRREMARGGRSKAWLQGKSIRLADLREIGSQLLAIHGQGEHRRLLDPSVQLELVDRFAGAMPLRDTYRSARARWREAAANLEAAERRFAELSEQEEWLRLQIEEIDAAAVSPGEEQTLRQRVLATRSHLRGLEASVEAASILFEEEGSALERIETALHRTGGLDDAWEGFREAVEGARDSLRRARRILPHGDAEAAEDPAAIEERLALIARMKKKYGGSERAILRRRAELTAQLEEAGALAQRIDRLAAERDDARRAAGKAAGRLRKAREEVREPLARAVMRELSDLGMPGAELEFVLEEEACGDDEGLPVGRKSVRSFADGVDRGWFRLQPNPGEAAGPLASVASGGELSRCLLALMTVLGGREEPSVAVFDEVDAGVGGATARAVALRLEKLAAERQVLLVTHLPLVACRAQTHFRVEKSEKRGRTFATVARLRKTERVSELARMLAGRVDSKIARKHAEELLAGAARSGMDG
jgi:DNA repair protein RecN (Recombination protein N)